MRRLLLLALAASALAQGLPPPKNPRDWESDRNQQRLHLAWSTLPSHAPTRRPDGTNAPARAPWPFLLYVSGEETTKNRKIDQALLRDTRILLASRAGRLVQVKPSTAVMLPYLRDVQGIKDPTLVVVGRDFDVVGVLRSRSEFTPNKVLELMAAASDAAYRIGLFDFLWGYHRLMEREERRWKEERLVEELELRAMKKPEGTRRKRMLEEVDRRTRAVERAAEEIQGEQERLDDALIPRPDPAEAIPTRTRDGRELTEKEIAALKAYREYRRDKNPIVRAAAVEDLGACDTGYIAEVVLEAARDMDRLVTEAVGAALGRMRTREAIEAMHAALRNKSPRVRVAALLGFANGGHDYPAAVEDLVACARSHDGEVRRAAIPALGAQGGSEVVAPLVEALEDSVPAIRVLAARELGRRKEKKAAAGLIECLDAVDWSLRKAAAVALGRIRVKESIEPLLRHFESEQGLMREVLYRALVSITGQDFRYHVPNWRRWWERYGKSFEVPSDAEVVDAMKRAAEALRGYAKPDKRKYHRIHTLSQKMVFVIDVSASMKDWIVIPPDAPPEVHARFPERVKLEIAKKELIAVLASLDDRVRFNIVTFAGKVKPWRDQLVAGSLRNAAIKFVSKLKPAGYGGRKKASQTARMTDVYGALTAAFGIAEEKAHDWRARVKVDTIFLLSDGLPTTGRITEPPKLIRAITKMNESRGVIIHVITFSEAAGRVLGPLAEKNGGQLIVCGP